MREANSSSSSKLVTTAKIISGTRVTMKKGTRSSSTEVSFASSCPQISKETSGSSKRP